MSAASSHLTCTALYAAAPPAARFAVKNDFIGTMPRGSSTYFPAAARLTVDSCTPMASATSCIVMGTRAAGPCSMQARWRRTISSTTRRMVVRRLSMLLMSQSAARKRPLM